MARNIIQCASKASEISGGALKIRHYFEHALSLFPDRTRLYMPEDMEWTIESPFRPHQDKVVNRIEWSSVRVLIITGQGWEWFVPKTFHHTPPFRVIYLVQGFDKFKSHDPRFPSFRNPAVRICVSDPLADTLRSLSIANGPVHSIPAAIDLDELRDAERAIRATGRDTNVLILGLKKPQLAQRLAVKIGEQVAAVRVLKERVPRHVFLQHIARARVVVCLPQEVEGWYLPALEAMALGSLTVVPQVVGNTYCVDGSNCIIPSRYDESGILDATRRAIDLLPPEHKKITKQAMAMAARFDLPYERLEFDRILQEVANPTT